METEPRLHAILLRIQLILPGKGSELTWHHLVHTPQEEVGQQGEEGGVEAVDCREIGQ